MNFVKSNYDSLKSHFSQGKKESVEQSGGGLAQDIRNLFLSLLVIVLFVVIVVIMVAVVLIKFFRSNRLTGGLTNFLCGFTSNIYIVLLSGIIETVTTFIPPVGIIAIPILKAIDTFGVTCQMLNPNTTTMTTVVGLLSLIPIGGALGKFTKFYMHHMN